MDYLKDVLKRFDLVLKLVLVFIAVNLISEILHQVLPNIFKRGSFTYYLPDHYMFVYIGGLVLFVLRYVLSGRTSVNPDKLD